MNATADDWESLTQIVPEVEQSLGPQARGAIEEAVRLAVSSGYLVAKTGDWKPASLVDGEIAAYWFRMSDTGRAIWETESVAHWSANSPNQSSDPTLSSGTSRAEHDPRLP